MSVKQLVFLGSLVQGLKLDNIRIKITKVVQNLDVHNMYSYILCTLNFQL